MDRQLVKMEALLKLDPLSGANPRQSRRRARPVGRRRYGKLGNPVETTVC